MLRLGVVLALLLVLVFALVLRLFTILVFVLVLVRVVILQRETKIIKKASTTMKNSALTLSFDLWWLLPLDSPFSTSLPALSPCKTKNQKQ